MSTINVNGQNGAATSANVNVVVRDTRANGGNFKWQVNSVKRIKAWFDIYDLDMSGVNLDIIVQASEIVVKAEHNGVKYHIDTPITAKTSMSKIDSIVGDSFRSLAMAICMVEQEQENEQVAEQEQENETADMEYLRKVMPVVPVGVIKEKIGECVKDLNLDTMDFNEFCDKLWNDYVWEEVFTDESLESETREYMEFNDRVRYIIENEINGVFINRYGQVEVEISNAPMLENENDIIEYIYGLDSRPSWVTKNDIKIANSYNGDYLDIVMFGSYHVGLYYDNSEKVHDFAKADSSSAYGIEDMRYAVEIMENRDYIVSLAKRVLADCEFNNVA